MGILTKFYPQQFKYRISLLICLLGILTMLVNLGVTISLQRQFITVNIANSINTQFRIIEKPLSEAILFDDIYSLYIISKSVTEATLFVNNTYILDKYYQYITDANVEKTFPHVIQPSHTKISSGKFTLYIKPIETEKIILGYLVFEIDEENIRETIYAQIVKIALVNFAIVFLGILFGIKLALYLTKPLENLTKNLNQINFENLPFEITGMNKASLEIKQLHQSLNSMSMRLLETMDDLYQKEKELARSEKLAVIGTIAAGLAHELKNPIMTINLLTFKLRKECDNENLQQDIEVIRQETDRLVKRTNDFLSFAKPVNIVKAAYPLYVLFNDLLLFVEKRYDKALIFEFDIDKKQTLWTDKEKFLQVFTNLINNSFEAGADWINVECSITLGDFIFSFIDNGKGFTKEECEKAFMPFFTTKAHGTGLGLSICEMILEAMDGKIQIDSEWNEGSRFLITLRKAKDVQSSDH